MEHHGCTAEELEELNGTVATFEAMAEIAVRVLERMRNKGQPIVQICGPMSTGGVGSLEANLSRFRRAINAARERGLLVFNQVEFQIAIARIEASCGLKEYNMDILEVFYRRVFECGHVERALFLPDWESSTGAKWERELVASLGIAIEEYPLHWL